MAKTSVKGQTDAIDDAITAAKVVVDATKVVIGTLADTAKKTADTSTGMNLLRANSDDITGVKTVVDLLSTKAVVGALADTAKETADTSTAMNMIRALLANLATADGKVVIVDAVVDTILATITLPRIARKAYTFDATAIGTYSIFTVTGAVKVKLYAVCTTALTPTVALATVSLGVAGTVDQFIAATLADDLEVSRLWYDATPITVIDLDSVVSAGIMAKTVIGDGADIVIAVAAQAITSGVIEFMVEWEPITANGNVVAV